ncbi:MAG: N-acetylmuramoyl-L-alanine amidase CwlD [Firmicutes bacterium]|nr:N-acetylmuramoyl-L-alanine amidase CwlD [Bacillota bacterium]
MKKYYFKNLFAFIILFFVFAYLKVEASLPLSGKIIVIDVGHGGKDPGTVSNTVYESNINLNISKYLEYYLSINGATVILTRSGDYDLSSPNIRNRKRSDFDNRIKIINNSNANLYLSIHLNYLDDSSYYGPQVFYNNNQKNNQLIAKTIQEYLNSKIQTNRSIKKIPTTTYMYSKLKPEGVLIECGFLSNYKEKNKLVKEEYQEKIAKYIAEAIICYY